MTAVSGSQVRQAVETSLRAHLPAQLAARGLAPIASWTRLSDFRLLPEGKSPAVTVASRGITGAPVLQEGGTWRVPWEVTAYFVVRGRAYEETADRVADYTAAGRTALLSDGTLGGLAAYVTWLPGESYAELDKGKDRTLQAGSVSVSYGIDVDLGGPAPVLVQSTEALIDVFPPNHPAL